MIAYEKAYAWQELFALAVKEGLSFDELVELGKRVGGESLIIDFLTTAWMTFIY